MPRSEKLARGKGWHRSGTGVAVHPAVRGQKKRLQLNEGGMGLRRMEKTIQHILAGLILVISLLSSSCGCVYTKEKRSESNGHDYIVSSEGADCGALNGYETSLDIEHPVYLAGHKIWTSKKTVFIGRLGLDQVKAKWLNDNTLSVDCRCFKDSVYYSATRWRDVNVTYSFHH
jgi:hypothetical protein